MATRNIVIAVACALVIGVSVLAVRAESAASPGSTMPPVTIFSANPSTSAGADDIAGISATTARDHAADQAYMHEHPVPGRPGLVAGIIISVTDLGDLCHMRVQTTSVLIPARGDDLCDAWTITVLPETGQVVRLECGGPGLTCPPGHIVMPGDEGEYVYVTAAGGQITSAGQVHFMACYTPAGYPCPAAAKVYPPGAGN